MRRARFRFRSIALGAEAVAATLQFRADLAMIVDFSVENDGRVAVAADYRLVAAFQVDDLEPNGAQSRLAALEKPLLVRSPVVQRFGNSSGNAWFRIHSQARKPCYSTHWRSNPRPHRWGY